MVPPPLGNAMTPPLMRLGSVTTPGTFAMGVLLASDREPDNTGAAGSRDSRAKGMLLPACQTARRPSITGNAGGGTEHMRAQTRSLLLCVLLVLPGAARAAGPDSVYVEELTWTELRDRIGRGATTVIVPIGGTEQNGPHMAIGKHNVRVRMLAGKIAATLGNA